LPGLALDREPPPMPHTWLGLQVCTIMPDLFVEMGSF
jgi:hypothetical protein